MWMKGLSGTVPIAATEMAAKWDNLWGFLVWLSVFFCIIVIGGMIVLSLKYRKKDGVKPTYIDNHLGLEIFWTVVPAGLLLVIFAWGYQVYRELISAPADAMEVRVIGKQWLWQFQYDDGRVTTNELFVPANKAVKLIMSSEDVIHSFFVPNFRVKNDVVPGLYTSVWFKSGVLGKHHIFCAEYCGATHSGMIGSVIVLDDKNWDRWRAGLEIPDSPKIIATGDQIITQQAVPTATPFKGLAHLGSKQFESRGCVACHSADGTQKVGPSMRGLYGSNVQLTNGSKVLVDDKYIRTSLLEPNLHIVAGFQPLMPTYKGQIGEKDINELIAYIKELR